MIFFVYKDIQYGGAELLIHRMAKYLMSKNIDILVLCCSISEAMQKRFEEDHVNYAIISKWNRFDLFFDFILRYKCDKIICFMAHDYFFLDSMLQKTKTKLRFVEVVHYVITSNDLCLLKSVNHPFLKGFVKEHYKRLVIQAHNAGNTFYMDKESVELTENYYGISLAKPKIVHLPYTTHLLSENVVRTRYQNKIKEFVILTVSRAELKMKGYLVKLMENFPAFLKEYPKSRLVIVSFGEDYQQLLQIYDGYPEEVKAQVDMPGKLRYEELKPYFGKASVYIGMGTTLLDAADMGVIGVPVVPYIKENITNGFFHCAPDKVTAEYGSTKDPYKLFGEVYEMGEEEFCQLCYFSHYQLVKCYDIDMSMKAMVEGEYIQSDRTYTIIDRIMEKFILGVI